MSTDAGTWRWHRFFAVAAVVHAGVIVATVSWVGAQEEPWPWLTLWVGVTTLWLFWPIIIALHAGRSLRRAYTSMAASALLLAWPIRMYLEFFAPSVFGGADSYHPYYLGEYCVGYASGWVAGKQRSGDATITLEGYGMGGDHTPGVPPVSAVAAKRYSIRIDPIALCGVSAYILGHAAGYNAVSADELKRRYGADIMDALTRESQLEQERYEVAADVGRANAERDIAAGQLTLEVFPRGTDGAKLDLTPLTERGVAVRQVAGENDRIASDVLRHAAAYNEVVNSEIERRYGVEVAQAVVAAAGRGFFYPSASP